MKTVWTGAMAVLLSLTVVATEADAKRLGGGSSIGRQPSSSTMQRHETPAPAATPHAAPAAQQPAPVAARPTTPATPPMAQPNRSRWLGPLAGLAAGLGIAALMSHFGMAGPMAEMMGNLLMIALLVGAGLMVWRLVRGRREGGALTGATPAMAGAGAGASMSAPVPMQAPAPVATETAAPMQRTSVANDVYAQRSSLGRQDEQPLSSGGERPFAELPGSGVNSALATSAAGASSVPADFDAPAFLRSAKVYFIRLQAAWDRANLADIQEFTTPEMFAEIRLQLSERPVGTVNVTDVVQLEAELLGVEQNAGQTLASVRFHGLIRETAQGVPEPFQEIWVVSRVADAGWILAGIRQIN